MRTQMFIDGEWRDAASGATFAVTDPATGEHVADVADAAPHDATAACAAASAAQRAWAAVAPREKAEILRRSFELMMERQDELAELIVRAAGQAARRRPRRDRVRRRVLPVELRGSRADPR